MSRLQQHQQPHKEGLALCHRVTLDFVAHWWVPARTPTVHGCPTGKAVGGPQQAPQRRPPTNNNKTQTSLEPNVFSATGVIIHLESYISGKIPSEVAHRHEQRLLVHKEGNDGGGKRANVQGRSLDGTETTKRSGLFAGTRWRNHVHGEAWSAHGAFDKTFKRWKLSHQTPPSMMLSAPFAGMEGSEVDGSWSGFADDFFHQR